MYEMEFGSLSLFGLVGTSRVGYSLSNSGVVFFIATVFGCFRVLYPMGTFRLVT